MTGFEPWSSGVGSDRSNNCTTTTALFFVKQNRPSLKPTEVGGGGKLKHQEVQRYSFKEIFVSIFSPAEIFRLSQCDRIGRFLKVLGYKFSNKSGRTSYLAIPRLLCKALLC